MDCELDAVFAALRGEPPADVRMLVAPAGLPGPRDHVPPPAAGKSTYGEDHAFHVDGPNITVQWDDPTIDVARAQAILDAAELGWTNLVEVDGWPVPVSADQYRLWFLLDPTLSGSGFTALYPSADYPDGYPVTWLNPAYVPDGSTDYALSVAVHELGHSLQYAVRDWAATEEESWYWEATSEWMANRGAPEFDTYAWSSYWYARDPSDKYDSTANQHQYGMFLLDTWLDEEAVGPLGVRDVWTGAAGRPWPEVLSEATGRDFQAVIQGMSGVYAAGGYAESALYYPPASVPDLGSEAVDELDFAPEPYGTLYVAAGPLPEGHTFYADDGFALAFVADGVVSDDPPVGVPFVVTITSGAEPPTSVHYGIRPINADTGGDSGATETPSGCGCGGGASAPPSHVWALAVLALAGRRRGAAGRRVATGGRAP